MRARIELDSLSADDYGACLNVSLDYVCVANLNYQK